MMDKAKIKERSEAGLLVSNSPAVILELLAQIERLEAERDQMSKELDRAVDAAMAKATSHD